MFGEQPLSKVCATAAELGYHGLELAPFTFAQHVDDITKDQRRDARKTIQDAGLETVGLHWLLVGPDGLHMTTTDDSTWSHTRDYFRKLVDLCGDLGGRVMVIGSPNQRSLVDGQTPAGAWSRAVDLFSSVLNDAEARNVTLCIEPLSSVETDFLNTVEEGVRMVREINHPRFKVHLDVKAMFAEGRPVEETIRSVDLADIGHFHVNDPNLYGPGMGELDFAPLADAIKSIGWDRWLSVEVFKYDPDPETIARQSMECLKANMSDMNCV